MSEAIIFVKVEPEFLLRDPRMLALSFEAKGLYMTLWVMPMDKSPRTEKLTWSSKKQMVYYLSSFEPEPDIDKIERLIDDLIAQHLILIGDNYLVISGFKEKHSTLGWGQKRGRKPHNPKNEKSAMAKSRHSKQPENYPAISRELPEELPDNYAENDTELPRELGRVEKRRVEKSRREPREEKPPPATQKDTSLSPREKLPILRGQITYQGP